MNQSEAFRVLASADRQLLLHELLRRDGPISVETLSMRVAARRHGIPPEAVTDVQSDRAFVRLVHQHLPRLQDHDVVTVDQDEDAVEIADVETVETLLEAAEELDQWPPNDLRTPLPV